MTHECFYSAELVIGPSAKSQSQRVRAATAWVVHGAPVLGLGLLGTMSTSLQASDHPLPKFLTAQSPPFVHGPC